MNRKQFNGIERTEDLGLNWNLAEFRSYDPAIGRWNQIDPVLKYSESPFAGLANSPVVFIDPLGADTLKQIGPDTYDGGYLEGATVSAKKMEKPEQSSTNNRSFTSVFFANRFSNWKSMGTGGGLSANPDFPQYSAYAEGIKDISWDMISPVLLGAAGGGGSSIGGARAILQRFRSVRDFIRLARAFRLLPQQAPKLLGYTDDAYKMVLYRAQRAPAGGIRIGGKRYEGGQLLPGHKNFMFGRANLNLEFLELPAIGNSLRPSPMFYPQLSPIARWTIGGGGAGLGLYWGLRKNQPK
ncbi:MAG: RHS repeat-associated core domain-containing protein [Saprospiraceae bacterium]